MQEFTEIRNSRTKKTLLEIQSMTGRHVTYRAEIVDAFADVIEAFHANRDNRGGDNNGRNAKSGSSRIGPEAPEDKVAAVTEEEG